MKWYRCSDKLPKIEEEVLVIDKDMFIYMALYKEWNAPCGFGFFSGQVEDMDGGFRSHRIQLKDILYWTPTEKIFENLLKNKPDDYWDDIQDKGFNFDCEIKNEDDPCEHEAIIGPKK